MRIVMLTDDVQIDRRILLEAESLIESGHEVILLAGWSAGLPEFEHIGRVKVERLRHHIPPRRLRIIARLQGLLIQGLNGVSRGSQWVIAHLTRAWLALITLCARGLNALHRLLIRGLNGVSWGSQRIITYLTRAWLKLITLCAHGVNRVAGLAASLVSWRGLYPYEWTLLARLRHYRPDIIHAHDLPQLRSGVRAKRRFKVPLIYDAHEFYPEQPRLTIRQRRDLSRLEKKYIASADKIITVNSFLAREMENRYKHITVSVIQNAINPPIDFNPQDRHDLFRKEYGFSHEKILVLYQGYIAQERNLEVIVKGMKNVDENRFVLLIMGYGDYARCLKELSEYESVSDKVIFVQSKNQDELLYYTASADIGLIPYPYGRDLNTHYVSPNKLYEFIVAGLPILTNVLPYVQHVVEQYGFGMCADLQTAEGFARALNQFPVEKLPEYRVNLLRHRKAFEWEVESKALLGLYSSVVGPAAPLTR